MSVDWAELYRTTAGDLLRFLYARVWDEERARDLVQEVFVRALRHEPEEPRAWLFSVAANLARDEARTAVRRRKHLTLLRAEAEVEAVRPPPVSERMEREEREARVRRALDALSDRDREVLLLWNAGLDYREIARQTGLARGAIGTTLARARRRLVEAHRTLEDDTDVDHAVRE